MRVGVFLGDMAPAAGGGFMFSNEILQALVRLRSKHTFVVFSNLSKEHTSKLRTEQVQFVCSRRGLLEGVKYKLTRIAASMVAEREVFRGRLRNRNWLQRIVRDLGIEVMWFATPSYMEVDIPYIYTVWDVAHRLQPWFPEVSANGLWRSREGKYATAIQRAAAVIIGTESGKTDIVHFYRIPPERVTLIPHPTPMFALSGSRADSKEVLAKYSIPEGYLFYPAQFWPHKNHVGLLLAVKLLRDRHDIILPVVFVGSDQGNLPYVRRMVDELGLSPQVHFLGFVPREDLLDLYRNAFALTYLTFFGPENLPPLEAFALGCPVIASNVSGAQEQLGDAALLVDPKSEKQIADAIKLLLDDSNLRTTLVSRGMARGSKWTAEEFVERVCLLIDELEPIRRCWDGTE